MDIQIEDNIPVPPGSGARKAKYPFARMTRGGQSFFCPGETPKSIRSHFFQYCKRKGVHSTKGLSAVRAENGGTRFWLLKPIPYPHQSNIRAV